MVVPCASVRRVKTAMSSSSSSRTVHCGPIVSPSSDGTASGSSSPSEVVKDLDVVLDPIGEETRWRSGLHPHRLERTGRGTAKLNIRDGFTLVEADYAGVKAIAVLVESGVLRAEIDTVLPLKQAAEAHRVSETGRVTGKIVLTV